MSHLQHNNVSQAFRGGEITAVMGGVELDLRECRLATDTAHLNVFVAMGGVELRIPRDWVVESGISLFMAGLDNRTLPPVEPSPKRLVIDGSAFMGGIEIKN